MSQNAIFAKGTKIRMEVATVMTDICDITGWTGPTRSTTLEDVTDLCSTAVEKKPSPLVDGGQMTLDIQYVPASATHAALSAAVNSGAVIGFEIVFSDTGAMTWAFDGVVTGFSVSGQVRGKVTGSVTIEVTGVITETP